MGYEAHPNEYVKAKDGGYVSTKLEKQVRRLLMSPAGRAALKTYGVDVEIVKDEAAIKSQPCGLRGEFLGDSKDENDSAELAGGRRSMR
jgi:hypothetical protein